MNQQSCVYGAECGLLAACECGCCIEYHECECDAYDFDEEPSRSDFDADCDDTPEPGEDVPAELSNDDRRVSYYDEEDE